MANGAAVSKDMKNAMLNRLFKASPDDTAFTRGSIGTGTTTPAEGDTGLETVVSSWNGGSDFRNYETSYPSFDTANKRVTVRMFVASTQANSNTLTEYGDFNTDGTPLLGGHYVYTGISKTSSIQVYYDAAYRVL